MENVFGNGGLTIYGDNWKVIESRAFSEAEKSAIRSNTVVNSDYGKSVCFFLKNGGQSYIPVSTQGNDVNVGDSIDMNTAKLVKLHREGSGDILRVEI